MPTQDGLDTLPVLDEYSHIVWCKYDEDWTRNREESIGQIHVYQIVWKVQTNSNNLLGVQVLSDLRSLLDAEIANPNFDPIPRLSFYYGQQSIPWAQDPSSFCVNISCEIIDVQDPSLWRVIADYGPVTESGPQLLDKEPLSQDPMKWPFFRWLEIIDDQEVVETAICLGIPEFLEGSDYAGKQFTGNFLSLHTIFRGPDYNNKEPGPIVNSAGQQTIDPQMELSHRMIYNVRVNYPNEYYAMLLNELYGQTVHAPDAATYGLNNAYTENPIESQYFEHAATQMFRILGFPHGTWKFLVAIPEIKEWRVDNEDGDGPTQYASTTIKFEIKLGKRIEWGDQIYYSGWNRLVLNNGQACFKRVKDEYGVEGALIYDPQDPNKKLLFPTQAWRVKEGETIKIQPTNKDELEGLMDLVETSEPINLRPDGTQHTDPDEQPDHIWYLNLRPANYFKITGYYSTPIGDPMPVLPVLGGAEVFPPPPPWLNLPTFP
jgi:hypothetical protein